MTLTWVLYRACAASVIRLAYTYVLLYISYDATCELNPLHLTFLASNITDSLILQQGLATIYGYGTTLKSTLP